MSPLRAGAIALTLIIAVPIILGYAFATEDSEVNVDVTENTGSLSDIILNSTTPYYVDYTGANNNGNLLRTVTDQGATETSLENPDYVKTSATTYSYTPIYQNTSSTVTLDAATTTSYIDSANTYGIGTTVDVTLPTFAIAKLTYTLGGYPSYNLYYYEDSTWSSVAMSNGGSFYAMPNENGYFLSGSTYSGDDLAQQCDGFYITVNGTLHMTYNTFYTIPDSFPDVWSATMNGDLVLKLVSGNTTTYAAYTDATSIVMSYGTVTVVHGGEDDVYTDITELGYAQTLNDTALTYYYTSSTITAYADVSYGWRIPTDTGVYYDYWMNGFVNDYVRIMLHMENGESFVVTSSHTDTDYLLELSKNSSGIVSAYFFGGSAVSLGKYSNVMVEISADNKQTTVTATGIASWPSIGNYPDTTYNTISRSSSNVTGDFTRLYMTDVGTNSVEIRVDSAEIVAGYFPSTKNYALNLTQLYPGSTRQAVIIDSIGIYGDYLTLGSASIPVNDNTITINGKSIPLKGASIYFDYDGSYYTVYVNGNKLSTHSGTAQIVFGGEWSLTLHRTETTTESVMQTSWVAGEFAFDENDFVLAMLLVAIAAFVGLGMTGGRSGTKVGVLALICGGAVLISLTLI